MNRILRGTAAALATTGLVFATGTAADAATVSQSYLSFEYAWGSSTDSGGVNARAMLYVRGTDPWDDAHYTVKFLADDELLMLSDNHSDGHRAQAEVLVYRGNTLVDHDIKMFATYKKTFELGTPDGTGDIAEGSTVKIRVRPEGGGWSRWVTGRA